MGFFYFESVRELFDKNFFNKNWSFTFLHLKNFDPKVGVVIFKLNKVSVEFRT